MKRDKPSPLLDDVSICYVMGWTLDQLQQQPSRFIDRLSVYLETLGNERKREDIRLEDEIRKLRNKRWL